MSDRELLESAAKAAGFCGWEYMAYGQEGKGCMSFDPGGSESQYWDPLHDDGDALRLAVNLGIDVAHTNIHSPQVHALADGKVQVWEDSSTDPYAATRRAIVRAAAEIGRTM